MLKIDPIKVRRLFQNEALPAFHTLANLWAVEDDAAIGLDLSFSSVYEIAAPDLTTKSDQEIAEYVQHTKNFLNTIPDDTVVQFLVQYRHGDDGLIGRYRDTIKTADDIGGLVVAAKEEFLSTLFIQNRKYYMAITISAAGRGKLDTGFFRIVLKDHKPVSREIHEKAIKKLTDVSETLVSQIKFLGAVPTRLGSEQLISLFYRQLNPSRGDLMPPPAYNPEKTLRSQIFFNACENVFDYVYLDGFYYRAVNLFIRPEEIEVSMLMNFMAHLLPDADLSIALHAGNQEAMLHDLHITDSVARNINNISGFKTNYEAAKKSEDAKALTEEVKTTFQKLFYYKFAVVLKDRSLEALTTRSNKTLQLFKFLGEAEGVIDDMNHLNLFLSILPNNSHLNIRKHMFHSAAAAQMLPLSGDWRGTKHPKMLLLTDNNELLPLDLFDDTLSAKHGLIIGQTGAGKSFATNYLLKDFFIESGNNHVIIIDVGGSYRKLCSLFKGQYLEVELSEKFAFNPFPRRQYAVVNADPSAYEVDTDVIAYITGLTQKMLNLPELPGKAQKILENAVIATYRNCAGDQPLLGDFHRELAAFKSDDDDLKGIAREYARNLDIWTSGRYGRILNRKNALTIDNRLVVFDLQKLDSEKELQSVIFFIISSVIEGKLKDRSLKKMIVIDEGWKFFNDPVGAMLIENLYRTARKFNAAIYSISQSPVDFLGTRAANSIISNSYLKFVLKIKSGYELLDKFGLNPQEIEKVRLLRSEKGKYSEIFLKFNENSRVIKIQPSPVDYWICTTDPVDAQKEADVRARHPDFTDAQIIAELGGRK
jgi:hypothetical protein